MNETAPTTTPNAPETTVSSVKMFIGQQRSEALQPDGTDTPANTDLATEITPTPSSLEQANAQASGIRGDVTNTLADTVSMSSNEQANRPEVPYTPDEHDTDHTTKDLENVPHAGSATSSWNMTEAPSQAETPAPKGDEPVQTTQETPGPASEVTDVLPKAEGITSVTPDAREPIQPTDTQEGTKPEKTDPNRMTEVIRTVESIYETVIEEAAAKISEAERLEAALDALKGRSKAS